MNSLGFFFQNFRFHQILFNLALTFAVHYKKKLCSVYHLFDNLQFGKRNYCLEKKYGKKSGILDPKICMNPVYMCLC